MENYKKFKKVIDKIVPKVLYCKHKLYNLNCNGQNRYLNQKGYNSFKKLNQSYF